NTKDSVEKNRHSWAAATHCKRGHPFSGDNLLLRESGGKVKRICKTCQSFKERKRRTSPEARTNRHKTHCVHGHPLSGDNLYVYPSDGRRSCRTCIREAVARVAAKRKRLCHTSSASTTRDQS